MYILIIGANPGDGELAAGGTGALWRRRGDQVRFLSIADGRCGHFDRIYADDPRLLIDRRTRESANAAEVIGATQLNLGVQDGALFVGREITEMLVREIRRFGPADGPDLVITSRPIDRPRDHAATGQMAIDAAALSTSPLYCPESPALAHAPTVAYWHDDFTEEGRFIGDVIIGIDPVLDVKTRQAAAHESQVFEWLPYYRGLQDHVPSDPAERLAWLQHGRIEPLGSRVRSACAESLDARLPHGRYAEAFQISQYGRRPTSTELTALFP